jgi:hypothetical protein
MSQLFQRRFCTIGYFSSSPRASAMWACPPCNTVDQQTHQNRSSDLRYTIFTSAPWPNIQAPSLRRYPEFRPTIMLSLVTITSGCGSAIRFTVRYIFQPHSISTNMYRRCRAHPPHKGQHKLCNSVQKHIWCQGQREEVEIL